MNSTRNHAQPQASLLPPGHLILTLARLFKAYLTFIRQCHRKTKPTHAMYCQIRRLPELFLGRGKTLPQTPTETSSLSSKQSSNPPDTKICERYPLNENNLNSSRTLYNVYILLHPLSMRQSKYPTISKQTLYCIDCVDRVQNLRRSVHVMYIRS